MGISPQSCTETDFEMKTSNFVLFLLISVENVKEYNFLQMISGCDICNLSGC